MNLKKNMCLSLVILMFLLLCACENQEDVPASENANKNILETGQSYTEVDTHKIPSEAEILAMLNDGDINVFWGMDEDTFSLSSNISAYIVEVVDGDTIWNALFSENDLVLRQQFGEYSEMLISLDGTEYTGRLYNTGMIEFSNLSEIPAALSSEHLMDTLSDFTGMDWTLGEADDAADTSTYYHFSVDGITIDRNGYSVGEAIYTGPFAMMDSSYVTISIPFRLGAKGNTLVTSDFISCEQAQKLCTVDLLAQTDFPTVVVFDHSELVYYCQAKQQMLLPAWRITGTWYSLSSDGALSSVTTVRLIDAQTGELHW